MPLATVMMSGLTPRYWCAKKRPLRTREKRDVLPENNASLPVVPQILTNDAQLFLEGCRSLQDLGYDVYDRWFEPFSTWQKKGHDVHSVFADPLFVDPEHDDYRLREDSPALKMGFSPLPIDEMGPYESVDRATWPIVEASGARETPVVIDYFREDA